MKEKSVFKGKYFNGKFGDIRVILDKEKPEVLFCAKDVAKALGFANPSTSVRDICLNTRKEAHMTDGGLQVLNFIDWGDIYNLYKHSKCEDKKEYIVTVPDAEPEAEASAAKEEVPAEETTAETDNNDWM